MDFKKILIASSAICAVGGLGLATADAAQKPKLKISGYYELFAGVADADRDGETVDGTPVFQGDGSGRPGTNVEGNFAIVHYGEIRFKISGKTDSGMKWGVYFEDVQDDFDADFAGSPVDDCEAVLETSASNADIVISGVSNLSLETGPTFECATFDPIGISVDCDVGIGAEKQSTDEANIWLSGSWGKLEIGGQDGPADKWYRGAEKLAHISPAMLDVFADTASSEAGRGFAREKMGILDSSDATKITYYSPTISGFQVGYSYTPDDEFKGSVAGEEGAGDPAHEFGIQYKGKFGKGKLQATWSGSLQQGDTADDTGALDTKSFAWRTGVTYSHGPWTVAAGYKDNGNERVYDQTGDETGWDIGAAYSGGRWEVSLLHYQLDVEDTEGDQEWDHTMLTGAYNLGGGLTVTAALNLFDLDAPNDDDGGNDGWAIIVGMGAKF